MSSIKWLMPIKMLTVALAAAALLQLPARAQETEGPDMIGSIPGAGMLRDEFRARARAQLNAIALNALVYHKMFNEYPATLYDLYNSDAWNLDVVNMFSGQPIDSVMFEAEPSEMTVRPYLELPFNYAIPNAPPAGLFNPPAGGGAAGEMAPQPMGTLGGIKTARVDPEAIDTYTPGDIFYFVEDKLIQLVVWAPDGTYQELVFEVPNGNWSEALTVSSGEAWPENLLLAQIAYYLERELPQSYNLVLFMGDKTPLPQHELTDASAAERLAMAEELGISILNPLTKQPIEVLASAERAGNIVEPDPALPMPTRLATKSGEIVTLAELRTTSPVLTNPVVVPVEPGVKPATKPRERPNRPPMGGKRS